MEAAVNWDQIDGEQVQVFPFLLRGSSCIWLKGATYLLLHFIHFRGGLHMSVIEGKCIQNHHGKS